MRGRLAPMLFALAVAATACAGREITAEPGEIDESTFVTHVADFEGVVGQGLSLTTDADGNPHMAYLAFEDPEQPGATPAPEVPGAPQLPAVKHAHLVGGAWTRSVVAEDQELGESDAAGIAVDGQGVHHVVWTSGGDLLYTSNAGGAFSEPEAIGEGALVASVAVTNAGIPFAAFFGAGGVQVTSPQGQQAISPEARLEPGSLSAAASGDAQAVAFADGGPGVEVATLVGAAWESEVADPEGAFGVSMDLDADGNPHLTYYTAFGEQGGEVRHAHSIGGAPWEISTVAEVAGPPPEGATTSIALAEDGTHHVAWQTAEGIGYATNADGAFAEGEVPEAAADGEAPRVAVGPEGVAYLAWYDSEDTEVQLAVRGGEEPLLAVPEPGPQPTGQPTTQPTGPPPCEPAGTDVSVVAAGIAFDTDCLAAPAGQAFTLNFDNQDTVPHNVAIYTAAGGEVLFAGDIITGPDTVAYEVPAQEEGQFYFQCDVHPNMNGTFVVA